MNRRRIRAMSDRRSLYAAFLLIGFFAGTTSAAGIQSEILSISGEVISHAGASGPVIIEVYHRPQFSFRPLYSKKIARPGPYEVRIRPGTYYLRAFIDENDNQAWDESEPVGIYTTRPEAAEFQSEEGVAEISQALIVLPLASKKGIDIEVSSSKSVGEIDLEEASGLEKDQE